VTWRRSRRARRVAPPMRPSRRRRGNRHQQKEETRCISSTSCSAQRSPLRRARSRNHNRGFVNDTFDVCHHQPELPRKRDRPRHPPYSESTLARSVRTRVVRHISVGSKRVRRGLLVNLLVRPDALIPSSHLSTKPGQVQAKPPARSRGGCFSILGTESRLVTQRCAERNQSCFFGTSSSRWRAVPTRIGGLSALPQQHWNRSVSRIQGRRIVAVWPRFHPS
jgi:hypothetical protein